MTYRRVTAPEGWRELEVLEPTCWPSQRLPAAPLSSGQRGGVPAERRSMEGIHSPSPRRDRPRRRGRMDGLRGIRALSGPFGKCIHNGIRTILHLGYLVNTKPRRFRILVLVGYDRPGFGPGLAVWGFGGGRSSGQRPGSYQPRAQPWVRCRRVRCRPMACFIGSHETRSLDAGSASLVPGLMNRAFSAQNGFWDGGPRAGAPLPFSLGDEYAVAL